MIEFLELIFCPQCSADLKLENDVLVCGACHSTYGVDAETGQADLRLKKPKDITVTFTAGGAALDMNPIVGEIPPKDDATLRAIIPEEENLVYGNRLSNEMMTWLPKGDRENWILDLGCGHRQFESLCADYTGMRYLGVDYEGAEPHALADAHALPFRDESFAAIISVAVLEHLAMPDVALREAQRVLKRGGVFIGTVAFLETFHMDSYYHMTHLGVLRALRDAGFAVQAIAPNREWSGLRAQTEMALLPGVPRVVRRAMIKPFEVMSRLLWRIRGMKLKEGDADAKRILESTGGFRFAATKL